MRSEGDGTVLSIYHLWQFINILRCIWSMPCYDIHVIVYVWLGLHVLYLPII